MSCGPVSPCAPVNPCDCVEPAAIREQGPPGRAGTPGGVPVFQIGTVVSGPVPIVTITQVNPLLYTLDFVIPSVGTNLPNTWTAVQTFDLPPVFVTGFTATGSSTAVDFATSGTFTMNGPGVFVGDSVFNGDTTFNGLNHFVGDTDAVNLTVTGDVKLTGVVVLPAATAIQGNVVIGVDGKLYFVVGSSNIASGSTALAATIVFNAAETAIAFNLPFTIPAGPDAVCGIVMQMTTKPNVNPPTDWSDFLVRCRLDNAVLGTVVGATGVTVFEGTAQINAVATIPAGSHTLFFTIQGTGDGTNSIDLTSITARISF